MDAHADARMDANELVEAHLYLVQHVVSQLASQYPRHIDRSELWSAGAAGLVDASRRYDAATGVPFARYATIRIRGAIIDSTRTRDWATRSLRRQMRTLTTATAAFEQAHGHTPTTAELAEQLGVSESEVLERRSAATTANVLHLDQTVGGYDDHPGSLTERIAEVANDRLPAEALEHAELVGTVRVAVEHLPAPQREVVVRHFFHGELLRDIADELGVTEARVSQIRSEALNAVRAYFSSTYEEVAHVVPHAPGRRRRASYVAEVAASSTWRSRLEAAQDVPIIAHSM